MHLIRFHEFVGELWKKTAHKKAIAQASSQLTITHLREISRFHFLREDEMLKDAPLFFGDRLDADLHFHVSWCSNLCVHAPIQARSKKAAGEERCSQVIYFFPSMNVF